MSSNQASYTPLVSGENSDKKEKSNNIAVRVQNLSKCYQIYDKPRDRLKQMLIPRFQRSIGQSPKQYYREFWALKDVSFEINKGETVGIVGRNGSGKSTLLQLICGTLSPTSGSVQTNGRVAALLELGSGFNPQFTGRENVYMNAAVLGLSKEEVDERFDSIASFADIGQFMEQPVKKYSSGMYVRLAFAVAINVDPQILVVDEALSVGDELFQRKCFSRIEQIRNNGATVLFVSHSGKQITQLCDRAILLDTGEKLLEGSPKAVVSYYQRLLYAPAAEQLKVRSEIAKCIVPSGRYAQALDQEATNANQVEHLDTFLLPLNTISYIANGARIESVSVRTMDGRPVNILHRGLRYRYTYKVIFDRDIQNTRFTMLIKTKEGIELGGGIAVYGVSSGEAQIKKDQVAEVDFSFDCRLNPGTYFTNAGVTGGNGGSDSVLFRVLDAFAFRVMPEDNNLATAIIDFGCQATVIVSTAE